MTDKTSSSTVEAATARQSSFIKSIVGAAGFIVPKQVLLNKDIARLWISCALATLTPEELRKMGREPEEQESQYPTKHVEELATTLQCPPPEEASLTSLRAWMTGLTTALPLPEANKVLRYWQRALLYRDLNMLADEKARPITERPDVAALAQGLPRLAKEYRPPKAALSGEPVALLLAYLPGGAKSKATALLGIPLAYNSDTKALVPPAGGVPFFSREWLEPPDPDAVKDVYFGTVVECDEYFSAHPPPLSSTWPEYWGYIEAFVKAVTGHATPLPDLAQVIGRKDTAWKIVEWDGGAATKKISDTYQDAVGGGELPPLLARLCAKQAAPEALGVSDALRLATALTGHMDAYDPFRQARVGFGLEVSQRIAATAMTQIAEGQLLTVNGPPGTGKTSFLRAVIGTLCVERALAGGDPPIILATAATNKAVTNIIESFAAVPGPAMCPEWQSRWLPNLPSYGWFYPASTKSEDDYKDYMVLGLDWATRPPTLEMKGRAAVFFGDQKSKRPWFLEKFLDLHRQTLGLSAAPANAKQAASQIQAELASSVDRMRKLQRSFEKCLSVPPGSAAFKYPQLVWEHQIAQLELSERDLDGQRTHAVAELQSWNQATQKLLEANQLRTSEAGLFHRIVRSVTRFFFGDRTEERAQRLTNEAIEIILALQSTFPVLGSGVLDAVKESRLAASRRLEAIDEALGQLARKLSQSRGALERWVEWRTSVAAIAAEVRPLGDQLQAKLIDWAASGFGSTAAVQLHFEEAIDRTFRFRHFHMAARYWEARWLDDVPSPTDTSPSQALRRAAMLAPVIVSTVYTLPGIRKEQGFADLLIFDEAGQASPEIGAASFAYAKRAIIVGDIYQLKPVWNVGNAADGRLALDLKIANMPESHSVSSGSIMKTAQTATSLTADGATLGPGIGLAAHYRCRAGIIEYCRRLIYGSSLVPRRDEKPPNKQSSFIYPSMAWVPVTPKSSSQKESGSWVNHDEVHEIVRWLRHDRDRLLAHYGETKLSSIVALIAPFRAQANALRKAITTAFGPEEASDMVINTVHALQGAEKPIVAFSLTQDKGPFFVDRDGPNLLNVAVSRAKDCFILFAAAPVVQPGTTPAYAWKTNDRRPLGLLLAYMHEAGKRLYPREVVIIEAPGKERRVAEALGISAMVISTGGHFRRLKMCSKKFEPEITNNAAVASLREVSGDLRHIDCFFLATDDDDDGEEIAWHALEVLREHGVDDLDKVKRMRFYSLAPDDIRRARELALPGVDARRVRANLLRGLFDEAFHKELSARGIKATRPQLALLQEIQRRTTRKGTWHVKVTGAVDGHNIDGYLLANDRMSPASFDSNDEARRAAEDISGTEALPSNTTTREIVLPRYPAGTTAQTLAAGYRRYGWSPQRTMESLQSLYLGHESGRSYGVGIETDPSRSED